MNNKKQELKKLLNELVDEQISLLDSLEDVLSFGMKYQMWYSKSLKVMESLGKDRLQEFVSLYAVDPKRKQIQPLTYSIQDYIGGVIPPRSGNFDHKNTTKVRLVNQLQILASLQSRIDTVLEDVEGHLFSDLQDNELKAAEELKKVSVRAAGALAGVVLERHLQRVATNHGIKVQKKNPTISDLNDPLKANSIYDVPTWRKIQYLADIRNMCSHQKEIEPTKEQVEELISGVNSVIKLVH